MVLAIQWSSMSNALKKQVDEKKIPLIEEIVSEQIVGMPADLLPAVEATVKSGVAKSVDNQAKHEVLVDILKKSSEAWKDFDNYAKQFAEVVNALKGTGRLNKERDIFLSRDVLMADKKSEGNVQIQPEVGTPTLTHSIVVKQLARYASWQSRETTLSGMDTVVYNDCTGISHTCIKASSSAAILKILIRNNRMASTVLAANENESVTGLASDTTKFGVGTFFLNDKAISIVDGDTLKNIAAKINDAKVGIIATVERSAVNIAKFHLVMLSQSLGVENAPVIKEQHNASASIALNKFVDSPQYANIRTRAGDSLSSFISQINNGSGKHQVFAQLFPLINGSNTIVLQSKITGIGNDIVLENEDAILGNLFKDPLDPTKRLKNQYEQDAIIQLDGLDLRPFKTNTLSVKLAGDGAITVVLYDTPTIPNTQEIFTIKENIKDTAEKITDFFVSYARMLYSIATNVALEEDDYKSLIKENNIPQVARFSQLIQQLEPKIFKNFHLDNPNYQTKYRNLESIGIKIVVDDLKNYKDLDKADSIARYIAIDNKKLIEVLNTDFEAVHRIMAYVLNGSGVFEAEYNRKEGIQFNSLNSFDFSIDIDRIQYKATVSQVFADPTVNIVNNDHSGPNDHCTEGIFILNNKQISIEVGDTLDSIGRKINAVRADSGVKASVEPDGSGYRLKLYTDESFTSTVTKKWPPIIFDNQNVLNNIFSHGQHIQKTVDFLDGSSSATNVADGDRSDLNKLTNGIFSINGISIEIKIGDTLEMIRDKILQINAGIEAKIEPNGTGVQLIIESKDHANIKLSDPTNVWNNVINSNNAIPLSGERFFDTTKVIELLIENYQGIHNKSALYLLNKMDYINRSSQFANIIGVDLPNDSAEAVNIRLEHFKLSYFGNGFEENMRLIITEGLAEKMSYIINKITGAKDSVTEKALNSLKSAIEKVTQEISTIEKNVKDDKLKATNSILKIKESYDSAKQRELRINAEAAARKN